MRQAETMPVVNGYNLPIFWRNTSAWVGFLVANAVAAAGPAMADAALILPAPPFNLPLLPSLARDWTVTIGLEGSLAPSFLGSKTFAFSPRPILSIQKAGSPEQFRGALDNPSFAIIDTGQFRMGAVGKLNTGRSSSTDKALRGLKRIDPAIELGGFAEYYPVDWFRTRVEIRDAMGGYAGLVGDASADFIVPLTQRMTVSGGPRFSFATAHASTPFFGIDQLGSQRSGLPRYRLEGASYSVGIGGQASYLLTPQWKAYGYVEYQRLLGSGADSPLVKFRGSPNQTTVGLGLSYAFDVRVR